MVHALGFDGKRIRASQKSVENDPEGPDIILKRVLKFLVVDFVEVQFWSDELVGATKGIPTD